MAKIPAQDCQIIMGIVLKLGAMCLRISVILATFPNNVSGLLRQILEILNEQESLGSMFRKDSIESL